MNRYVGTECPVCHIKIFEEDEIVVCPDCGAPYHKHCWDLVKSCVYKDDHGTDRQYTPPKPYFDSDGEDKPQGDLLGDGLKSNNENARQNPPRITVISEDDDEESREAAINGILQSEGVRQGDKIDGVSTRSIALFVGVNAKRYIKVFKEMFFNESKVSWNWLAFLFPQYWLLGRKCYQAGSLVTFFQIFRLLMIQIMNGPSYTLYNHLSAAYKNPSLFFTSPDLLSLVILLAISLLIHIFMGLFGDYLYKRHVFGAVDDWQKSDESDDEMSLMKKGGVNVFVPILVYMFMDVAVYILAAFIV